MEVSNTPESVAFALLQRIAEVESKKIAPHQNGNYSDRKCVLDTYAECLLAVKNPKSRLE